MARSEESSNPNQRALDRAALEAALECATLPYLANRFEIFPAQIDGFVTLIIGGALSGSLGTPGEGAPENHFAKVEMHGAYVLNRELAIDMATKLQLFLRVTEEEKKESLKRLGQ